MCVAALSCAPISMADAQSVYVAPGGVCVASGNVYLAPAPAPYGAPVPGVAGPATVYAPPPAYGAPAPVYVGREPAYVVRERILAPTEAYAVELPPRSAGAGTLCRPPAVVISPGRRGIAMSL